MAVTRLVSAPVRGIVLDGRRHARGATPSSTSRRPGPGQLWSRCSPRASATPTIARRSIRRYGTTFPRIPGHEPIGRVVATGAGREGWRRRRRRRRRLRAGLVRHVPVLRARPLRALRDRAAHRRHGRRRPRRARAVRRGGLGCDPGGDRPDRGRAADVRRLHRLLGPVRPAAAPGRSLRDRRRGRSRATWPCSTRRRSARRSSRSRTRRRRRPSLRELGAHEVVVLDGADGVGERLAAIGGVDAILYAGNAIGRDVLRGPAPLWPPLAAGRHGRGHRGRAA